MGCSAVHVFETHLRHPVLVRTCRHTIHANHGMLIASVEEIGFLPSFLIGSETKICSFPSWSNAFPSHFFTPSFELFIKWPRSWKDPKGCILQGPPNYRCNHGMDMNFGVFFRHWSMRKDDQRKFWVEHVRVRQEWCHTPTHVFRIRIEFCTIHMQHYRDHTFGVWLDKIKTSRNCEPFGCTVFFAKHTTTTTTSTQNLLPSPPSFKNMPWPNIPTRPRPKLLGSVRRGWFFHSSKVRQCSQNSAMLLLLRWPVIERANFRGGYTIDPNKICPRNYFSVQHLLQMETTCFETPSCKLPALLNSCKSSWGKRKGTSVGTGFASSKASGEPNFFFQTFKPNTHWSGNLWNVWS